MKKKVNQYVHQLHQGGKNRRQIVKDFSKMLDDQVTSRGTLEYCM
jgi:arginyl-tRNA--protein-N-Asp/Glu arginylyltransferase